MFKIISIKFWKNETNGNIKLISYYQNLKKLLMKSELSKFIFKIFIPIIQTLKEYFYLFFDKMIHFVKRLELARKFLWYKTSDFQGVNNPDISSWKCIKKKIILKKGQLTK
jgi:hypothetical protein